MTGIYKRITGFFPSSGPAGGWLLAGFCCLLLSGIISIPFADDLFSGRNPYVQSDDLRPGEVLKLVIDEPVVLEYEYESDRDDHSVIKLSPDKQILPFLPGASDDRSFTNKGRGKIRVRGRLRLNLAVRIAAIENGVVRFAGTRRLGYEEGRLTQTMQATGFVSVSDIARDHTVLSRSIADFTLTVRGAPVERRERIPLKTEPPAHEGEPPRIRADLSDAEKQRILLEYLNRLLGETGTVLP